MERYRTRTPVKRLRQERDWSQLDLAAASGVSNSLISRFERGLQVPSAENLLAIAKVLDVEPWQLLDRPELAS